MICGKETKPFFTRTHLKLNRGRSINPNPRKRYRSVTPPDDYPIPDIDDMRIPPERNTYTRAISGRKTQETPSSHWEMREEVLMASERRRIRRDLREIEDLTRRREERKKRDEEEMHQGLQNFNGRQRGWNGERESVRQQTIREYHETEDQKAQAQFEKERAAAESSRPPLKIQRVNSEELKEVMEEVKSRREIEVMVLEDAGNCQMEQAYNMMMSRNVDMDVIIAEAHGRSRQDSGAAPIILNSPTRSPSQDRDQRRSRTSAPSRSSPRDVPMNIESPSPEAPPSRQSPGHRQGLAEEEGSKENDLDSALNPPTDERRLRKRSRPFGTDITDGGSC